MMRFQFWLITAGIMVWPAHAFGLVPGGLAGTAILSILCFFVSFLKILKGDVPPRLHLAAAVSSIDECRQLLLSGLNPNSVDKHGRTALFQTILNGDIELVRLFMEFDTDPNISDKFGNASLHHVSSCRKEDRIASIVDALVEHGANLDKKNHSGLTPLEHARNLGRTAAINAIASYDSLADPEVSEPDAPRVLVSDRLSGSEIGEVVYAKDGGWIRVLNENDEVLAAVNIEHLPQTKENADLIEKILQLEQAPNVARTETENLGQNVMRGLNPQEIDLLMRKIVLDNLLWTAEQGMALPFGLKNRDEVEANLARVNKALERGEFQHLKERLEIREQAKERLREAMIEAGVMDEERLRNPNYFHHMVLEYANLLAAKTGTGGKKVKTGFWHRGPEKDILANYFEAEAGCMFKAHMNVATQKFLNWLRDSKYNHHKDKETGMTPEQKGSLG